MKISIITPAFGQLDWLWMCVTSVADQVGTRCESAKVKGGKVGMVESKVAVTEGKQRPGKLSRRYSDGGEGCDSAVYSKGSQSPISCSLASSDSTYHSGWGDGIDG